MVTQKVLRKMMLSKKKTGELRKRSNPKRKQYKLWKPLTSRLLRKLTPRRVILRRIMKMGKLQKKTEDKVETSVSMEIKGSQSAVESGHWSPRRN